MIKTEGKLPKPYYITTPIYYVNDRPHIGHAYTTIAADLLARFQRLNGRDAFFLTGTDEHGNKIAEAAEARGIGPQEFCDEVVEHFKKSWQALNVKYDYFIRTTDKRHEKTVQQVLEILKEAKTPDGQDVIYPDTYEGLYCTGCEKFLTDKDLVDGLCPHHKKPPQKVSEKNYFFRLTSYLPEIKKRIESGDLLILPEERRREVLGLIDQELNDFSLSREKVKWGIPLPFDRKQVAYVWVDALTNYISGIGFGDDKEAFKKWWYDAEVTHLMAKDILKFHCLYWPAMLMALDIPLPNTIYLHGFFTVDGEKMSKSLGNMIDPFELIGEYGPDATRYMLLTQYPFGVDGDIQRSRFTQKYNSDLANDLGNLVSRVARMIGASFDGKLPGPNGDLEGIDELVSEAEDLPDKALERINHYRIGAAIDCAMNLVRSSNRFFDSNAPWKLLKEGKTAEAGGAMYICSEAIRIVATVLAPVMPEKCLEILAVFGLSKKDLSLDNARTFYFLEPGMNVKIGESIFPRIKEKKKKDTSSDQDKSKAEEGLIDISEFGKVKLIVAEVLEAEKVDGADKLLRLQIDVGSGKRQIVAGIAQFYEPENLIGRKIIVVSNLKPAKIRGIESNGMLLAAKKGKKLTLVTPEGDIPPGASVG